MKCAYIHKYIHDCSNINVHIYKLICNCTHMHVDTSCKHTLEPCKHNTYLHACIHTQMCIFRIYIQVCTHMHTHMHLCICLIGSHACIYIHTHRNTCTIMNIHECTHTINHEITHMCTHTYI